MGEINIRCTALDNLQELAAALRILPFPEPRPKTLAVTADPMKGAAFLIIEIKNTAKTSALTAGACYFDASQPRR
jgi:hypothetical protein